MTSTELHHMPGKHRFLRRFLMPIIAIVVFAGIHYGNPTVADDIAAVATIGALVDHGTLAISSLQFLDDQVGIGALGPDGQLHSKYGIGQVLLGAPLYMLGRLIPSPPFEVYGVTIAESQNGVLFLLLLNSL